MSNASHPVTPSRGSDAAAAADTQQTPPTTSALWASAAVSDQTVVTAEPSRMVSGSMDDVIASPISVGEVPWSNAVAVKLLAGGLGR